MRYSLLTVFLFAGALVAANAQQPNAQNAPGSAAGPLTGRWIVTGGLPGNAPQR
jgi:hypothetical protein